LLGLLVACVLSAGSFAAAPAAEAAARTATAATRYARVRAICPPATVGRSTCQALLRAPVASSAATGAGVRPYAADDGAAVSGPAGGLTPAELASAYGYEPQTGGSGQTIGIVDAYDDPNIESDLATFDTHYKLPACTVADGCFKKVSQTGAASLPPADTNGWSVETSLDVETAHAVCGKCKILLVEADSELNSDLAAAVNEAVALGATEVSNSYAGPEVSLGTPEEAAYNHPGVPIVAATGDEGYDGWTSVNEGLNGPEMPDAPASLPTVVAVGGTALTLNTNGTRASESVWNDDGPADELGEFDPQLGATGGGCSTRFTAQPWQSGLAEFAATGCGSKRLAADVSAVGDPYTGFDLYDTYRCGPECEFPRVEGGWATFGGTSLSAPIISAMYGLAGGGGGVKYPALSLYGHVADASARFDVTSGGNGYCGGAPVDSCGDPNAVFDGVVDCNGTAACNAAPGFDGPSGVGTPIGLGMFKPLLPSAAISSPASPTAGAAASFSAAGSRDPYPGGSLTSYAWSWGDGSANSGGVSPTHTYAAAGSYTVTLTVTDSYGLTSAASTRSVAVGKASNAEEEARKKAEEEAAAAKKREEEAAAAKKREEEAAAAKKHEEEAAAAKKREEEAAAAKKHEEEAATLKKHEQEAAAAKKREEEAAAAKKHEEEAAAAKKREEAAAAEGKQEAEAAARKHEEEESLVSVGGQAAAGLLAAGPLAVPDAKLQSTALAASASGAVSIRISCPAGESSCSGTVTLQTLDAVSAGARRSAKKAVLTLARASFAVAGGHVSTVRLHLSARARALLARSGTMHVRATIIAHDPAGGTHTAHSLVTLHAQQARHSAKP
jgi:PKD repeat protein